jgi:hypothetical protein
VLVTKRYKRGKGKVVLELFMEWLVYGKNPVLEFLNNLVGARNRLGIGFSFRAARLHSLGNWFLGIDS